METYNIKKYLLIVLAAFLLSTAPQSAFAESPTPLESGTFDCSCKDGTGTCTFKTGTTGVSCYRGPASSCSGTCTLTLTPDATGGAAQRKAPVGKLGKPVVKK